MTSESIFDVADKMAELEQEFPEDSFERWDRLSSWLTDLCSEISLCTEGCGCMTHTVNSNCGKCGVMKYDKE